MVLAKRLRSSNCGRLLHDDFVGGLWIPFQALLLPTGAALLGMFLASGIHNRQMSCMVARQIASAQLGKAPGNHYWLRPYRTRTSN